MLPVSLSPPSLRYFVLDTNTRMLRRYKARVSVADPDAMMSAESPRIPLDDVIKVTEAVQQPAPDAAAAPGVAFHTRFDLVMKDGSRRCFDTPTPEDARCVCVCICACVYYSVYMHVVYAFVDARCVRVCVRVVVYVCMDV